jgi:pilus assembly protein Flp/PilA
MNTMIPRLCHFLLSEDGPAAVEYAVMLALIITVCITVIRTLGASTIGSFGAFSTAMSAAGSSGS